MRKLSRTVGSNVEKKKMSVRLSMQSSKKDMVVRENFHLFRNEYQGDIFEHSCSLTYEHPRIINQQERYPGYEMEWEQIPLAKDPHSKLLLQDEDI